MILHKSACLDQNQYCAGYPHHPRKSPHMEELYANIFIRRVNWRFENVERQKCYRLGWVACRAKAESALDSPVCVGRVEVHLILCLSSVSADSFQCHFRKEGSRTCGFDDALLGVCVSQPSPFHAQETHVPASSVRGTQRVVSLWAIWFPPFLRVKSLPWPFWPYSTPGACRSVPAVPDLLALP